MKVSPGAHAGTPLRRWCAQRASLLASLLALWSHGSARAQEKLSLRWDVPGDCAAADAFALWIEEQSGAHFVEADPDRELHVSVHQRDGRAIGEIALYAPGEPFTPREVGAENCHELLQALRFVALLALSGEQAPLVPESAAAEAGRPVQQPHEVQPPPPSAVPAKTAGSRAADHAPTTMALGRSNTWAISPAAGLEVLSSPAPSPVLAAAAGVSWTALRGTRPGVRVGFSGGATTPASAEATAARFRVSLARVEVSPAEWSLGPCVLAGLIGLEAGRVVAEGVEVERSHIQRAAWIALTQVLRLETPLSGSWYGQLALGMTQPLRRDTYTFAAPSALVHQVPRLGAIAGLAFGYRFSTGRDVAIAFRDQTRGVRPIPR